MDDASRLRYGDSKSVPDNWIKRRRKPGDADQYEASEVANDGPIYYENETSGKAHEMPEAYYITDLDQY